jgi:hypothetical protein
MNSRFTETLRKIHAPEPEKHMRVRVNFLCDDIIKGSHVLARVAVFVGTGAGAIHFIPVFGNKSDAFVNQFF